jgi:hypothetical protein
MISVARRRHDRMGGAGDETRTRDNKLGKLGLYQLSYARSPAAYNTCTPLRSTPQGRLAAPCAPPSQPP